jgi:hypothetical protein
VGSLSLVRLIFIVEVAEGQSTGRPLEVQNGEQVLGLRLAD